MKHTALKIFALSGVLFAATTSSIFAATITLTNGGVGQSAGDTTQFGIAICNGGAQALAQNVPITVSANGKTANISSPSSIAAGSCEYTYVPYGQFGMQSGQTYIVSTAIDPQRTMISNTDNVAEYNVTVPAAQTAQAPRSGSLTANAAVQFTNPFATFWNWLSGIFKTH